MTQTSMVFFFNCIYLLPQVKSFRVIVVLLLEVMFRLRLYLLRCFERGNFQKKIISQDLFIVFFFFLLIQTIKQKNIPLHVLSL